MSLKRVLAVLLTGVWFVSSAQQSAVPANDGASDDMVLIWSDEFDYEGAPDASKWDFERGFLRNEELQWYQPQNAVVGNGVLKVTAKKEKLRNPGYKKGAESWIESRKYAECSSSSLITKGKFDFRYGRLEVRAKVPTQKGAWSAVWTMGVSMPWASCGEIDVMECYRENGDPSVVANVIHGNDKPCSGVPDGVVIPISRFERRDPDWAKKFHIWTLDWDENKIDISIDGELVKHVDIRHLKNGSIGNYSNPFHQNHYILLNLAVSGSKSDKPKWKKNNPMEYEVDYVRVYQRAK